MTQASSHLLFCSFLLYLIAVFFYGGAIRQKKGLEESPYKNGASFSSKAGIIITIVGFFCQLGYFITRWIAAGHVPVSNMFEFIAFFSMMIVLAYIILYFLYRTVVLGLFTMPVVIIMIAYGSMFSRDITPLIPALQSYWLPLHVMTTAAGQGILAISFIAGMMYLIKTIDQKQRSWKRFLLELIMYLIVVVIGFVISTAGFRATEYEVAFTWTDQDGNESTAVYTLPAITGPNEWEMVTGNRMEPLFEAPPFIDARKLNTVIWSFIIGTVLYLLIRLVFRKRLGQMFQPYVQRINSDLLDEISYRSVLIGFPVFTLGGLIFGMIWAQVAWTRFWAWDPKEVWALITWLFYAAFLHLRLSRGWHGEKSAWLAVTGFGIIMFNLVFVNLIIAGLHSYA